MSGDAERVVDVCVPLEPPIENANGAWHERRVLEVTFPAGEGFASGKPPAEVAPLPGYSDESFEQCLAALRGDSIPDPPSVVFAREMARMDRALGSQFPSVPLCALVRSLADADDARDRGALAFKMKIGPEPSPTLWRAFEAIRQRHPGVPVRLDANRSLPVGTAKDQLAPFLELGVEFVEEPCDLDSATDLETALEGVAGLPLALDESLRHRRAIEIWDRLNPRALVLKPTVLGGRAGCAPWIERARLRGIPCVLSHTFGGPGEMGACLAIATDLESPLAHGLFPHAVLGAWPKATREVLW